MVTSLHSYVAVQDLSFSGCTVVDSRVYSSLSTLAPEEKVSEDKS